MNQDLSLLKIVRAGLTAADAGDRMTCEAVINPDLVVTPEPIRSREAWLAEALEMAEAFPDLRTEALDRTSEGDLDAVHCRLTSTRFVTFNGVDATGRVIEVINHDFYRVESDQVVEACELADTVALFGKNS